MYTIATQEGVGKLYRGLLPRLLRVPPGMAITWCVAFEWCKANKGSRRLNAGRP